MATVTIADAGGWTVKRRVGLCEYPGRIAVEQALTGELFDIANLGRPTIQIRVSSITLDTDMEKPIFLLFTKSLEDTRMIFEMLWRILIIV